MRADDRPVMKKDDAIDAIIRTYAHIPVQNINFEDNVNSPKHYTNGDIEVIDYMKDKLSPEQFEGYCLGNVIKYVSRHELKNGIEDLEKAQVYLGWSINSKKREPLKK